MSRDILVDLRDKKYQQLDNPGQYLKAFLLLNLWKFFYYRKFTLTVPGGQNKTATLTQISGNSVSLI